MPSMPLKDDNNASMPIPADSTGNSQCGDSTGIHQPSDGDDAIDARCTRKGVKKSER